MGSPNHRDQFPVTRRLAFLNHAAVGPLCRAAAVRIARFAAEMAEGGSLASADLWREVETVRDRAARWLHCRSADIAFVPSTSAGLALVAEGFPWKSGDNVVSVDGEYPSNVYPWMHLADRGVELRRAAVRPDGGFRAADVEGLMDGRTRLLSVSHVQFASGFRCDLAALGNLCRRRSIDFCVDAIQSLGVFEMDVEGMGIDYLAADGHKWLFGPEGSAILFVRPEKLEKIRPTSIGWKSVVGANDYSTIDFRLRPDAGRFEPGSFNVVGILGLGASLEYLESVGRSTIEANVKAITDELVERLRSVGATLHSARGPAEWSGIVSASWGAEPPLRAVHRCRQAGVVVAARGGRLRISPHFYNDEGDLDRLIAALVGAG